MTYWQIANEILQSADEVPLLVRFEMRRMQLAATCLLYTSDAADERSSVDLGGRRIIKKKKQESHSDRRRTKSRITETVPTRHTKENKE